VNGVVSLRVVDSSIMPQATAGDLNAPTIMLAERASDLIRGQTLPPADEAPLLADPDWATRQRSSQITRDYANDRDALREALLQSTRP
jgi:choline dehydrogenase